MFQILLKKEQFDHKPPYHVSNLKEMFRIYQKYSDLYRTHHLYQLDYKNSSIMGKAIILSRISTLKQKILDNPGMYDCVSAYEISRIGRREEVNYAVRNFLKENKVQLIIPKPHIKLFDKDFRIEETANMTSKKERLARGKASRYIPLMLKTRIIRQRRDKAVMFIQG